MLENQYVKEPWWYEVPASIHSRSWAGASIPVSDLIERSGAWSVDMVMFGAVIMLKQK